MFHAKDDLKKYVSESFPEVTDSRLDEDHWDILCSNCKIVRGFQVIKRHISHKETTYSGYSQDYDAPVTYLFRCPVCKAFKHWIVYEIEFKDSNGKWSSRRFKVASIPSEGIEEIDELPDEPPSLKIAYRQAVRAMDANAHLAAAAMFRRALQIITRDLLKATPGNLANELNEVAGKKFNGGTISENFASIGYIIKEAGNQSVHPDRDPDLLDFTADDADDLQKIFMEVVSELFVVPTAREKAKSEFMARRKILPKPMAKGGSC